VTATTTAPVRHLRPRGNGVTQPTTTVELFFDLVYVFAVTQLSHQILGDLSVAGVARAAFLLLVVWWAWIYTTWMANWFDPASPVVRVVLTAVMLGSLLMAAALPEAFGKSGLLFAASYVALQVGRNVAAAWLLNRRHRLQDIFERLVVWSAAAGVLWLAGAALDGDQRLVLWVPALALELAAPAAGYWLPRRGRAATTDYDIEGAHFVERCQTFILIALGESIVVTGATASTAGLTSTVVLCLIVAFVETAALSWLYFGETAEHARVRMSMCEDPGRLARDAYTYLHLPIIAGIIAIAVANDLLIAGPDDVPRGVALAMIVGGPSLYLLGESLFRWRMTGVAKAPRVAAAALLILLAPLGGHVEALPLSIVVTALLTVLAVWDLRAPGLVEASARAKWRSLTAERSRRSCIQNEYIDDVNTWTALTPCRGGDFGDLGRQKFRP
jgi:low temperature requirement protein LtrA